MKKDFIFYLKLFGCLVGGEGESFYLGIAAANLGDCVKEQPTRGGLSVLFMCRVDGAAKGCLGDLKKAGVVGEGAKRH